MPPLRSSRLRHTVSPPPAPPEAESMPPLLRPSRLLPLALGALLLACREPGPVAASSAEASVLEQSAQIDGRDGGLSTWAWGQSIWVYGDTVLTVEDPLGHTWHHNSVSMTADTDASDGLTGFAEPLDPAGAPDYLLAPTEEELAFNLAHDINDCAEEPCGARWAVWPGNPVFDEANQRVWLFYSLIYAEPGDYNFRTVGVSLAPWDDPAELPTRPVVDPDAEHPTLLFDEKDPWGVASLIRDDRLFTFACDGRGLGHRCRLARAPLDRVLEAAAWQYWEGEAWGDDPAKAAVLFDGAPIMHASWNAHLGAFLVVYSSPFSRDIVARTAPALTGPWSREAVWHEVSGEHAPYDAVHHPEYEEDGGRVQYITFSRPTTGWFGTEFPVIRVELE